MVEHPAKRQFDKAGSGPLTMARAIASARSEMAQITDLPLESIIRCERAPDDGWIVAVEVVESAARMGDNDYLAAYELRLGADGGTEGLTRLGRYRREDGGAA